MAYFHCLIGGGSSGGGYELTVTCDADFAGTTITCTDGVTTLTQTCPSASPYEVVFAIPNGGEWTISGIISGQTYSASIDIPDSLELNATPEGSTVLPTDDIQTWLACAGITDKSYTTLNEVLADSTTLLALMSNNNAVDYLVRSTTWASGITADSTAMTDIGANDYCANKLLANSTWCNAICNSTYFESVLNVKVPTMTSNTAPSGECIASGSTSGSAPWYCFRDTYTTSDNGQYWQSDYQQNPWIGYKFPDKILLKKYFQRRTYQSGNSGRDMNTVNIQASNDGINWVNLATNVTINNNTPNELTQMIFPNNSTKYQYFRIYEVTGSTTGTLLTQVQFYGRVDV